jgi:hypothetical protein
VVCEADFILAWVNGTAGGARGEGGVC